LKRYNALIQNAEATITTAIGMTNVIKQGPLNMRPPKGGDNWPEYMFYINESEMVAVEQSTEAVIGDFKITPNCSVFETNLGTNTFELVTAKKVLHVQAKAPTETTSWIEAIREAISRSYLDTNDPLFQHAMLKIDDDVFYKVAFNEKKPLGVVFERTAEWAVIKTSANQANSGIRVGSVLSSVNGQSVILDSYQNTIDRLKDWKPPLVLEFRLAPQKSGYLLKESKSRSNPSKRVWKKRYFVLGEGKLCYYDSSEPDSHLKGETPLMGSVVSLVSEEEVGRPFCFRVMSGMTYLTLQSATERQVAIFFQFSCRRRLFLFPFSILAVDVLVNVKYIYLLLLLMIIPMFVLCTYCIVWLFKLSHTPRLRLIIWFVRSLFLSRLICIYFVCVRHLLCALRLLCVCT
jgi:hypothetical protein